MSACSAWLNIWSSESCRIDVCYPSPGLLQTGASTGTQQRLNPTGSRKHRWSPNKQEIVNKWLDLWWLSVWREHASNFFQPCTSLLKSSLLISWRVLTDPAGWEISYTLGLSSWLSFGLKWKTFKWQPGDTVYVALLSHKLKISAFCKALVKYVAKHKLQQTIMWFSWCR